MIDDRPSRQEDAGKLARFLVRYSQPRVQMFLILVVTAAVGAGMSMLLLQMGLSRMWIRYPLAALVAYLSFLVILRSWVQHQLGRPDLPHESSRVEDTPDQRARGSLWDDINLLDVLDLAPGLELSFTILFVVAVGVLLILLGVIVAAPVLLAEVLLDGLLVAGLWHRFAVRGAESSVGAAVRSTVLPAIGVIVGLGLIGFLLQAIAPGADSIGDVFLARNRSATLGPASQLTTNVASRPEWP